MAEQNSIAFLIRQLLTKVFKLMVSNTNTKIVDKDRFML